jgi:uncharacterized protein (TIGR04255 family)
MKEVVFANVPLVEVALEFVLDTPVDLEAGARLFDEALSGLFTGIGRRVERLNYTPGVNFDAVGDADLVYACPTGFLIVFKVDSFQIKWTAFHTGAVDYPGFTNLEETARAVIDVIGEAGFEFPLVRAVSLSYENAIITQRRPTFKALAEYFKPSARPRLPVGGVFATCETRWMNDSGMDQMFAISNLGGSQTAEAETDVEGAILTSHTGALLDQPERYPSELIYEMNRCANTLFLSIISEKAKKEWGYDESVQN